MRHLLRLAMVAALPLVFASPTLAGWQPGGTLVSPAPGEFEDITLSPRAAACSDGAEGFLIGHVSEVWYPGIGHGTSRLRASRITSDGDLAPGWPADGVLLASWGPEDPNATSYQGTSIVPDGAAGAHLVTRMSGYVAGEWLERLRRFHLHSDGSMTAIPADPSAALLMKGQVAAADGAGGVIVAGIQITTAPPLEPPPPAYLVVRREDAAGVPLWTPSPGAPGVALAPAVDVAFAPEAYTLQILGDGAGGCWVTSHRGPDTDLRVQRVLGDGSPAPGWPADGVAPGVATGPESGARIVPGPAGAVYVAWEDARALGSGGGTQVYLSLISADGAVAPGWPDGGIRMGTGTTAHALAALAPDGDGGVYLVRAQMLGVETFQYLIRLHHVGPDGLPRPGWPSGGVTLNPWLTGRTGAALMDDGLGGVFVVYSSGSLTGSGDELVAKRFTGSGTPGAGYPADGFPLDPTGWGPALVRSGNGVIAVWNEFVPDSGNGGTVRAQRLLGDGPVPVALSLVSAEVVDGAAALRWYVSDASHPFTVERRTPDTGWTELATVTADGTGRVAYEDHEVDAGGRYGYRLRWVEGGAEATGGEAWVDIPAPSRFALERAWPNPAAGPARIAFSLPADGPARLDVADVAGRLVLTRALEGLGAGRHVIELDGVSRLPAGVYVVRLTRGAERVAIRMAVTR